MGADTNTATALWGTTPLTIAARFGHSEIVKLLLKAHASVNIKSKDDNTALILAARFGHTKTVQILLCFGADTTLKDAHGETALEAALSIGNQEIIQLLSRNPIKRRCIVEIRKNARVLSLLQGPEPEDSPISKLPPELLAKMVSETNDQAFDNRTRYDIAYKFFKRPSKNCIEDEEKYVVGLSL